nr:MAG TPA: repressor domain protein [Caudoviricetes sp.]
MSNEIIPASAEPMQIFNYDEKQIRTVAIDGEPWFVLKDVCEVLGISKYRDVAERLDEDERGSVRVDTLGGTQRMTAVNESGLYHVIIRSDKPVAKPFRKWITADVLPTMRKTGGYVANDDVFIDTYLPYADEQTKLLFRSTLETVKRLNEKVKADTPKVTYFDALIDRGNDLSFRETAKELHIGEREMIRSLIAAGHLYRDKKQQLRPYAETNNGYFTLKEYVNGDKTGTQTLVTVKGRKKIAAMFGKSI